MAEVSATVEDAACRLRHAYNGRPLEPLRDLLGPHDAQSAYAVQSLNTRFWIEQGRRVVGRKIGLTARTVQRQLGVDQPDYGVLFADMQVAHGGALDPRRTIQPKAEAEIALVLKSDLVSEIVQPADVAAATDYAQAAIEIVDSRIADWRITLADTVADNASAGYFVLGPERRPLGELDLIACTMTLQADGAVVSAGSGAACMGNPLVAAAWLASTLASLGDPLRAGDVVLTGALGPMVVLTPGMSLRAEISGLGVAEFDFVGPSA